MAAAYSVQGEPCMLCFSSKAHHMWCAVEVLPLACVTHFEIMFQIPFQVIMNTQLFNVACRFKVADGDICTEFLQCGHYKYYPINITSQQLRHNKTSTFPHIAPLTQC